MGYVNTPAHMSASLAVHGGDTIWPGNQKLVIRRANIYSTNPANLPTGIPGTNLGDLGFAESIGPILQAIVGAGTATYGIIEARKDKKKAEAEAKKAQQIAAQAAEAARIQAEATMAQVKQAEAQQASQGIISSNHMPLIIGASVAGIGLLIFLLKR